MLRRERMDAAVESWRGLLPAAALLAACLIAVVIMHLRLPKAGEQLAVVFPPGTSLAQAAGILGAADARLVRSGGLDNIVVAEFTRDMSLAELVRGGMWLALDPQVAGGCLAPIVSAGHSPMIRKRDAAL